MSQTLREQYEAETGEKPYGYYGELDRYVAWLERRAACAEKLAEALKASRELGSIAWSERAAAEQKSFLECEQYTARRRTIEQQIAAALADYEAAKENHP